MSEQPRAQTASEQPSPRTVILAVIACTFFVGFGGGVVFPILPNREELLGFSAFLVGLSLSANRFVRVVAVQPGHREGARRLSQRQ